MKMAKASEADLDMAMELCNALESITARWGAAVPDKIARVSDQDEVEYIDSDNAEQSRRILDYLSELVTRASLMRVVWGCAVMIDPRNKLVDPDVDTIEAHPDTTAARSARVARPAHEYNDDLGAVLWWQFPINEPPYVGSPGDSDWPGYHTHWTPINVPDTQKA